MVYLCFSSPFLHLLTAFTLSFQWLLRVNVLCFSLYEEAFHVILKLAILNELAVYAVTFVFGEKNWGLIRLITQEQELGLRL